MIVYVQRDRMVHADLSKAIPRLIPFIYLVKNILFLLTYVQTH